MKFTLKLAWKTEIGMHVGHNPKLQTLKKYCDLRPTTLRCESEDPELLVACRVLVLPTVW